MIKADIVNLVAREMRLKDKEALEIVDEIIEQMKDVVVTNGRLEIRDFGVFQVKTRKARLGRNPRAKQKEYAIPARQVVTFKAGKVLREKSEELARIIQSREKTPS